MLSNFEKVSRARAKMSIIRPMNIMPPFLRKSNEEAPVLICEQKKYLLKILLLFLSLS